jgi:hypothetical protein
MRQDDKQDCLDGMCKYTSCCCHVADDQKLNCYKPLLDGNWCVEPDKLHQCRFVAKEEVEGGEVRSYR